MLPESFKFQVHRCKSLLSAKGTSVGRTSLEPKTGFLRSSWASFKLVQGGVAVQCLSAAAFVACQLCALNGQVVTLFMLVT